ncbi:MAG TPA: non-homologous end-joining DNA ligase [Actinomycetota bacterium]
MPRKRGGGPAFTVETPEALPAERDGEHWWLETDGQRLRLSNLGKVYWPEEGYTKGDLLAYYWNVAPTMLPYLAGRPLTMKRMPDGVAGPHFYEKNAPSHTPDWMPRCRVESEDDEAKMGYNDFLVANDRAGLLFVANLGAIEFHPLHSRCDTIRLPDYLFFDLDPFPPIEFEDVLAVARHVKAALDALGLPCAAKTSGATGIQIYVGIEPGPSYEQTRGFVGTVGRAILAADPDRVTMDWDIEKRTGKVFIDHNMNRRGANISAVYSVRPEPGATVSTPLTWDEVEEGVLPSDFTIVNVHERLAKAGDLFRPVLERPVDLRPALEAVGLPSDVTPPRRRASAKPPDPGPAREKLATYGEMRDFEGTPEPPPAVPEGSDGPLTFVIQKHDATRLHYDLRLERDGVMPSWAVPRGLPLVPGDRRLAVHTEDHPLDYAWFQGWIPEGHYGAGEVRIFDRGTYEPLEWTDDKVSFRLHGTRHRGEYHLIRTRDRDWLIFLSKNNTERRPAPPPAFAPMLADPGHEAFDDPAWRFEPKLDGVRTLAYLSTDATRLVSRRGRDQTAQYPELANLARFVNALHAVIDGEIVAFDDGRPSFELLQQRINLVASKDIERARRKIPVTLFAFDLLWLDDRDLTKEPLEERRRLLEEVATATGSLGLTYYVDGEGKHLFEGARDLGYEGIVAKRLGSTYLPGKRSKDWRKVKAVNRQDCVILGWTPGEGARGDAFGALLVGAFVGRDLRWIGQVGTGFTEATLADLMERLTDLQQDGPPTDDPKLRAVKGARWVTPELVAEVEYLEITKAGKLRAPSYKGLRPDKAPEDCVLEPTG